MYSWDGWRTIVRVPAGRGGAVSSSAASLGDALGVAREVERADVLVAGRGPRAAVVGIAAALVLVAVDGVRLEAGADVRDHLLRVAAVARGEGLLLALRAEDGLGPGDAVDARMASSAARRSAILRSSGTANGSSATGVS